MNEIELTVTDIRDGQRVKDNLGREGVIVQHPAYTKDVDNIQVIKDGKIYYHSLDEKSKVYDPLYVILPEVHSVQAEDVYVVRTHGGKDCIIVASGREDVNILGSLVYVKEKYLLPTSFKLQDSPLWGTSLFTQYLKNL